MTAVPAQARTVLLWIERLSQPMDADAVHQMRVDIQKLRAGMFVLSREIHVPHRSRIDADLKWLRRLTASVRDCDILQEACSDHANQHGASPAIDAVSKAVALARHEGSRTAMLSCETARIDLLVHRLLRLIAAAGEHPELPSQQSCDRALESAYSSVLKCGADIDELSVRGLHRLRRKLKRLRYVCEEARELYNPPFVDALLNQEQMLLRKLGAVQDAVAVRAVSGALEEDLSADGRSALRLIGRPARSVCRRRKRQIPKAWRRFTRINPFWRA